jgi:hypothetical protein
MINNSPIFDDLAEIFGKLGKAMQPVAKFIVDIVTNLLDIVLTDGMINTKKYFKDLEDIIGGIKDLINGDFSKAWDHLKDLLIDNKVDAAKEKFQALKDKIGEVATSIKEKFSKENMDKAFENIGICIGLALDNMARTWNTKIKPFFENQVKPLFTKKKWDEIFKGIKTAFDETMSYLKTWFTKEKWQEFGNNMFFGIKGGINKIIGAYETMINGVIAAIRKIAEGYNKVAAVSPYLKTVDLTKEFQPVKFPRLATGAVIPPNSPFAAVLGDQKRGTNIETPLDTMIQAFKTAMAETQGMAGDLVANITLKMDSETIYEQQQKIKMQKGITLATGGSW